MKEDNWRKGWFGILVLTLCVFEGYTQQSPAIKVIARASEDSVILRWAPNTPVSWKHGNKVGYTVERIRVRKNGKLDTLSIRNPVILDSLKPWPLDKWEYIATHNRLAAIAAQSLYGDSFTVTGDQDGTTAIKNQIDELQSRFNYSLMCADQSVDVAKAMALRLVDKAIIEGEEYLYRVYVTHPMEGYPIDTGFVSIDPSHIVELPKPDSVMVEFGDKRAILSWQTTFLERIYSNYSVERSDDGGKTYFEPSSIHYVDVSQGNKGLNKTTYFVDSIPVNYHTFFYRVRGLTPFGEFGPYSSPIQGEGYDEGGLYVPAIYTELTDNSIRVRWEYPEILWDKILGYNLMRAPKLKGQYNYINEKIILPQTQQFLDGNPQSVNYYKIEVVTLNGKTIESFEALGQLADSIPPDAPIQLSGNINENGIVSIDWKPNTEKDIFGYRVYRANNPDDEFVQATKEAVIKPHFEDSININVLNEEIYYKIMALDNHFNPSSFSQVLELQRPDNIPPAAPVISNVISYQDSIKLEWEQSSSTDVVGYLLFREFNNEFELLEELEPSTKSFIDKQVIKGKTYGYYLQAKDDVGLISESSIIIADALDDGIRPPIQKFKVLKNGAQDGIILTWQYEKVDRFYIYKAIDDAPLRLATTVEGSQFDYVDTNVQPGNSYTYSIKALLKNGAESPMTKEVQIHY